jgi:hypothetical protein
MVIINECSVILFYFIFLVLTIINQLNFKISNLFREIDFIHILPKWTFFAPNPGTFDFHLLFREMDHEGNISNFKEINLLERSTLISLVWNSNKRLKKALFDLVLDLGSINNYENKDNYKITFSYLAILNFLSCQRLKSNTIRIQFAIIRSDGYISTNKPTLVFNSDFHDL